MKRHLEALLQEALTHAIAAGELAGVEPPVTVETPVDPAFGDFASDVALRIARALRRPPHAVAERLLTRLHDPHGWLASAEVAGPGFVNLRVAPAFWRMLLAEAVAAGDRYGLTPPHGGRARVDLFLGVVDGPLRAEHGRAAVFAEATVRLLGAAGCDVSSGTAMPEPGDCALADLSRLGVRLERMAGDGAEPRALVRIARDGEGPREVPPGPVRVTRGGELPPATLRGIVDEVGPDAARFFLLLGPPGASLELDLGLAKRERTDNPLFYARYAEARLASALGGATAPPGAPDLGALGVPEDELVRSLVSYPDVVDAAARRLEPHRIQLYALDLAAAWHRYYNRQRTLAEDPALVAARLALIRCVQRVLRSASGVAGGAAERP